MHSYSDGFLIYSAVPVATLREERSRKDRAQSTEIHLLTALPETVLATCQRDKCMLYM